MIHPRRVVVGEDPVDLTEGTGTSGVSIMRLVNKGKTDLYIGEGDDAMPLEPGEALSQGLDLAGQEHLVIFRRKGSGPVDVISRSA